MKSVEMKLWFFQRKKIADGLQIILKDFLANLTNLKFSTENCSLKMQSKLFKFSGISNDPFL